MDLSGNMDKERLRLIVKNLDLLVQSLKEEIETKDKNEYRYEQIAPHICDYDEVFYDDDED